MSATKTAAAPEHKVCVICRVEKPLGDFVADKRRPGGRRGNCRACEIARAYANPERIRRIRAHDQVRRKRNLEQQREHHRTYSQKPEFRLRDHARNVLQRAVETGRIVRPATCSACGAGGRIEGHHHDYNLPFDVEWLCVACHGKRHQKHSIPEDMPDPGFMTCQNGHPLTDGRTTFRDGSRYCPVCLRGKYDRKNASNREKRRMQAVAPPVADTTEGKAA